MEGQVVLVTGGGSGIGRAIGIAFATQGVSVVVADVAVEKGNETIRLIKRKGGAIVNIASIAGFAAHTGAGASPYIASKHGVIGLTKAAALEYAKEGIRINAICPGITDTPLIGNARSEVPAEVKKVFSRETIPMGRIALPEEIAGAAIWLCSNAASFITGHALVIDGGMLAE